MRQRRFGWGVPDLAIDLGTANTLIHSPQDGILLDEPSVVAYRLQGHQRTLVAVGHEARRMQGRTPEDMRTVRPLKEGAITDFDATADLLQTFLQRVLPRQRWQRKPRLLVCVPCTATSVERRAIRETLMRVGARSVDLIWEPVAAALGADLPIDQPKGSLVVDVGGGTTEMAVMALSGVVHARSIRVGGDTFDEAIAAAVRQTYACVLGEVTAERVKMEIGSALQNTATVGVEVRGRHALHGMPTTLCIPSDLVAQALQPPIQQLTGALSALLEQTPAELCADLAQTGVVLTGGGALLRGLDVRLSEALHLPVRVAADPLHCVVHGAARALAMGDPMPASLVCRDS